MLRRIVAPALAVLALHGCSDGAVGAGADMKVPEKRCGSSGVYFSAYDREQIAKLAGCTVLVGFFQQDSITELEDFSGLETVHTIEGNLNVFRSSGFKTLRGLDNLEVVDGNLYVHLNDNLRTIAALGRLRRVTGSLVIRSNGMLPQAEVAALGARVEVGGQKLLE